MSLADHDTIDFVSLDSIGNAIVLSLVEDRPWGERGERLPDLQAKLNTYVAFALDGQLTDEYPEAAGKKIRFRLHYAFPPTQREIDFIAIVRDQVLEPEGIAWQQGPIETSRLGA